jgi:putative phosphonate transport system ATP-binding protein
MDEPPSGLGVSVQARLLDLIRVLVARLLAHRSLVMHRGRIVEQGLTNRVLDDPQHAYAQLLVASVVGA